MIRGFIKLWQETNIEEAKAKTYQIYSEKQLIEAMRKDGIVETEYCNCNACKFRRENYEMEDFTYKEAKDIAEKMGVSDAPSLIRTLQALNILTLRAEPRIKIRYKENDVDLGYIQLEYWPEGLVLWVGGSIVWKSFK